MRGRRVRVHRQPRVRAARIAAFATGPRSPGSPTSTSSATSAWAACTSSAPATSPPAASSTRRCSPSAGSTGSPGRMSSKVEPDRVLTRRWTAPSASRASISRCCCRRSRASDSGRSTARAPTSPTALFLPNGFMRVDADYTPKPYEQWKAGDWPRTYQSPDYLNVFAAGIAFAPPHAISRPAQEPERHRDRAGAPAHRHALGDDRQGRRPQHRRHDRRRDGRRRTPPRWRRWAPPASPPPAPTRSPAPPRR